MCRVLRNYRYRLIGSLPIATWNEPEGEGTLGPGPLQVTCERNVLTTIPLANGQLLLQAR